MDLILWRHAEAEDGRPDLQRELTAKGRKQAQRVAEWLQQRLPDSYVLVSSPAARAQQTAEALGRRFRTEPSIAPGASVAALLAAAQWPDHKGAVILVGHQPDLGRAAAHLVAGHAQGWSLKKGGLWWLSNRVRDEEDQVVVRAVISPDLL
ncbi:MAG TPA: phosphohistidine phosphatase SixA [Burkholderiales bacterium]|nr:phosphohistidine phosphatase SixA [Burkholderiales bacterium]